MADESLIAVFVDFENLAIGSRDMHGSSFRIDLVQKRLLEKGRIVFKRAYCDWNRYRGAVREFHAQGFEMVDIPIGRLSGKNSADIRMVVDALDLCYGKEHIDTFALLTGDSDFSPLVNKLKENNKRVIGCGVKSSTSDLLVSSCDEFLYYDDLVRTEAKTKKASADAARPSRARGRGAAKKTEESAATEAEETATAAAEPAADEAPKKRGRRTKATSKKKEAAAEKPAAKPAAKPARGRGRSKKAQAAEEAAAVEVPAEEVEAPAKKTRGARGGRGRSSKKKTEAEEASATESSAADPRGEGINKLLAIVTSLAQDYDPVWGSLVKQTLRRVHPDFREEHYGFASFVELLKEAETRGLVTLEYDTSRGNYKIRAR